ncbi:hypothetical protein D5041_03715 [Verminephrobacter aporrectodeae subsp. tuberculatae]|uniref:Xylose isomerase-like TIM barrel domain-containing protein n=1 Tax=Verminephrobacter aporrectodeae subsp. tuberculatae TaxID=1110392 RepID=A0ABT3KTU9_9BURK|nr:sugar phosphate isomerase/epimerase family protein [Verminephrobacter aporrectodeae]MCW5222735.1 hypothetical protein [Verminephrobacter aporrectodeae subsp. tuberculatae]MCW5257033.1 hypothetical protein [Verminephrobacter aporrectodeae subsp. tuberculatae]MCW5288199.1 hypothetical protein [Verminephrobacter aporrectodeae subsp. tuberculatae]MCW5321756.1 hypothetical protein [Verminephrobacter aporrectodeae subsp. tuberculatae]MCW8163335.1 hypothetical protein [Verminephrobacter aporrectod
MMKTFEHIGVSTNLLDDRKSLAASIERLADDFSVIEIEIENDARFWISASGFDVATEVDRCLAVKEKKGLYFSVHGPYLGVRADIANLNEKDRCCAVDLMLRSMALAAHIGATRFTFHPGLLTRDPDDFESLFAQLRKSLVVMAENAVRLGLTLCIENTGNERPRYIKLDDMRHDELCKEFGVRLTMDLVHFASFYGLEDNYLERLLPILEYVDNIHIADMNVPKHIHLPLGAGTYQYDRAIEFVFANGYTGNIIVEERGSKYSEIDYIKAAADYRRRLAAT